MNWQEHRSLFRTAAESVATLLDDVADFTVPGIGNWDLGGLAGHFLRAVRTPIAYLQQPVPEGEPLASAPSYIAGYLRWRRDDPVAADEAVATRGSQEFTLVTSDPARAIRVDAARLDEMLGEELPTRRLPTRFGPMRLDDYLRTRSVEVVVHGLDIARALDVVWNPPAALLSDVLALLADVAVEIGDGENLLLLLSGRIDPKTTDVLPVLR